MNLICAGVEVADPEHGESSSTFAFVFAGYSVLDGGFQREATAQLDDQVNALDAFWFDKRPGSFVPPGSRCDRPMGETITCRVTSPLRDVPGRPKLTLRGLLKLDAKRLMRSTPLDAMPWSYDMRGRVTWRRCPSLGGRTPRHLRGRACHLDVRWNGRDDLFQAVVRTRRIRG